MNRQSKQQSPVQIGGSDRGPRQLDEARSNQGLPPQGNDDETEDEALASGRTESAETDAARRQQERTSAPPPGAREPLTERKKL
ncbi:MAG TPA: hypothetical protein VGF45_22785 [Polyangia bacterium]